MVTFFGPVKLNSLNKNFGTRKKKKKENFNKSINELKQDTFELKNKNISFRGKGTKDDDSNIIDDVIVALNGDKYFKSSDPDVVNKTEKLVISKVGKFYDPQNNKELAKNIDNNLTSKVIVPMLKSENPDEAARGIRIVGKIAQENRDYAIANIYLLDPFIQEERLKETTLAQSAIKSIGYVGAGVSGIGYDCASKLIPIIEKEENKNLYPELVLEAADSIYKIALESRKLYSDPIEKADSIKYKVADKDDVSLCNLRKELTKFAVNSIIEIGKCYPELVLNASMPAQEIQDSIPPRKEKKI